MSDGNNVQNESEAIKKLKEQKAQAELQKEIAEHEKDARQAIFDSTQIPFAKTSAESGAFKLDEKAGYVSELVSYKTMTKLANEIGNSIGALKLDNPKIMIIDNMDLIGEDTQLIRIESQIEYWNDTLSNQVHILDVLINQNLSTDEWDDRVRAIDSNRVFTTAATTLAAIGGVINSAASIAKYFQGDYDVKSHSIEMSTVTLKASVASSIKDIPVFIWNFQKVNQSDLLFKLKDCFRKKEQLNQKINILISQNESDEILKDEISKAKIFTEGFEDFYTSITTIPEGKQRSLLTLALIRDQISNINITHYLCLNVISSGGEFLKARHFWQSSVCYSGGCVLSYFLTKTTGELVASDTIYGFDSVKYRINQKTKFTL